MVVASKPLGESRFGDPRLPSRYRPSKVAIYESGVARVVEVTTFLPNDTFRVGVEGGVVRYRKNGVLLYTSTVNQHPGVVSILAPLPGCAKCARVTGLSVGVAQLRPYSIINGGHIAAAWQIAVR
jgi:hypothetical protein